MTTKSKVLSLVLSLLLAFSASANNSERMFSIWMAFQAGDTMLTNMDVEDYICVTNMSDEMMINLFKRADRDYNKYQVLRREWAQARFKDGLRQYAYIYAMQKMATNKFYNKEGRKAFNITREAFRKEVKKLEDAAFGEWVNQPHLGIRDAYEEFGKRLKKAGYPHKMGTSNTDLTLEWRKLQLKRITENLRIQELRKYEYISALGVRREFFISPIETSDFQKEVSNKINELDGSRMTADKLAKEIESDPRLAILIKNAEFLGPDNTTLGKLKDEAPEVFDEFKGVVESDIFTALDGKLIADINRYEEIAKTLAQKYKDASKLNELADEMKKEFLLGTGDFNHFMMARLYTMAAIRVEQGENFKGTGATETQAKAEYLTALMEQTRSITQDVFDSPESLGTLRLEDFFIQEINKNPARPEAKEILSNDDYLKEYKAMAHWVVKFQFKKAALKVTPMVAIDMYDGTTYERYERIKNYLVHQQFTQELDRFRHDTARRRAPYMRIQTAPGAEGEVYDSWNFVLEKFPKR